MKLGKLLDVEMLRAFMKDGYVLRRNHPTLPLAILNYSNACMFQDFWPEVVQQCRGLIVGAVHDHDVCDDCEVISRPFHKFFNLNHSSEPLYHEGNLPAVVPTVTEKMDGWFGILWKCIYADNEHGDTHYGVASRGSFDSPGANFATGKLAKLIKYGAVDEFPAGYSAVFEIIFKAGRIVVDYPFEGLVLLGLINNETGEEMPYDELRNVWAKIAAYAADNRPWIRLVKAHDFGSLALDAVKSLELNNVGKQTVFPTKNQEGFVLSYPRPGTFPIKVKVKFEEYKRLHKLITGVTPQQIWGAVHDPMAPWVGSNVPAHFREWAIKWRDELYGRFHERFNEVQDLLDSLPIQYASTLTEAEQRRDYFEMLKNRNADLAPIAMTLMNGKIYEAHQAIWNRIRPVGREDVFYREGQGE